MTKLFTQPAYTPPIYLSTTGYRLRGGKLILGDALSEPPQISFGVLTYAKQKGIRLI